VATDQGIKPPVCASLIGLSSHTEATSTITANPSAKTKFRRGPIPLHAAELPPLCVLVHTGGGGGVRRGQPANQPAGKARRGGGGAAARARGAAPALPARETSGREIDPGAANCSP
jgi:hypothetical protein